MWTAAHLTPARLPILEPSENILVNVSDSTLFDERKKVFDKGNVILTQFRLIFVTTSRKKDSVEIQLSFIERVEYVAPWFMGSVSKVRVYLRDSNEVALMDKRTHSWTCEICSFTNTSDSDICSVCGVKAEPETIIAGKHSAMPEEPGVCPKCTFHNHPSLQFCEMCMSPLKALKTKNFGKVIKFELVNDAAKKLFKNLEHSINQQPVSSSTDLVTKPKSPGSTNEVLSNNALYGLKRLQLKQYSSIREAEETLRIALSSEEGFREVHKDVVKIASKFNLGKTENIPVICCPQTDDSSSIASQLVDLLIGDDLLEHYGGMLTLYDLYVLYNRSRGFGLVSPQMLLDALHECEALKFPLNLRKMGKVTIVESRGSSNAMLLRLVSYIKKNSQELSWRASAGFSARDISENFGYSIQIATEQLIMAESSGQLCRDEHITGLRFFLNCFKEIGV